MMILNLKFGLDPVLKFVLASCMVLRKASGSEFAAFGSAVLQVRRHTV